MSRMIWLYFRWLIVCVYLVFISMMEINMGCSQICGRMVLFLPKLSLQEETTLGWSDLGLNQRWSIIQVKYNEREPRIARIIVRTGECQNKMYLRTQLYLQYGRRVAWYFVVRPSFFVEDKPIYGKRISVGLIRQP